MHIQNEIPPKIISFQYPEIMNPFFTDFNSRYIICSGGRASAKSWSVVMSAIQRNFYLGTNIVIFRDFASSLDESIFALFKSVISELGLENFYKITNNKIINLNPEKSSRIIFRGYDRNTVSIKGLEGFSLYIIEEGETLTEEAFDTIDNTIRIDGSQGFIIFNPQSKRDFIWQLAVENPLGNSVYFHTTYLDNPWCPRVTRELALDMKRRDYEKYEHLYLGQPRTISKAHIFASKISVESFEVPEERDTLDERFYHGVDWGFSQDEMAVVKCYLKDSCLFISHELYETGVSVKRIPFFIKRIPSISKGIIYADSNRPDLVSHCLNSGLTIYSVNKSKLYERKSEKEKGNKQTFMKASIDFMLNLDKIVIHPRCVNAIKEFKNFMYKVDKRTGEIFPQVAENQKDHLIDATRYALAPKIRMKAR